MTATTLTAAFNPLTESRLSVKEIKSLLGMEGSGFRCKVYFDDVLAGEARDNADGGPVQLLPVSVDLLDRIHDYLSTLPKMPFRGVELDITLDIAIVGLVQAVRIGKALTRVHKDSICFARLDTRFGSFLHAPCLPDDVDATIAAFDKEFGTGQWLMLANPRDGVVMPPEYYKADAA